MTTMQPRQRLANTAILILEDSTILASSQANYFRRLGAYVDVRSRVDLAQARLSELEPVFDVVLIDHDLGQPPLGIELTLWLMNHTHPLLRGILRISHSSQDSATILGTLPPDVRADAFHAILPKTMTVRELAEQIGTVVAARSAEA